MSVIKELAASPFFDDYDAQKDFLRVLFRPGRAVQARELNQLQSILQMQVERFANHIFKDGSIVYGGGTTIDTISARYLKMEELVPGSPSEEFNPVSLIGKTIKGVTSGAIALVTTAADKTSTDPKTLIIKELNGIPFIGGETIRVVVQDFSGNYINDTAYPNPVATIKSSNFYGKSSTVSISDGIFYTKGMFVICNSQTVPLDKYSNTPNKKAGLLSQIQIVSEGDDPTLLDNATGTYNYSAPGASRLKVILTLESKDLNYTPSPEENFIELLETRDGKLYKQISRPNYNELMKTLARRTYNESGNYTVRPFILNLDDHPSDESKLRAYLSPGLAYVNGFEFETIATQYVDINKARDTETTNNYGVSVYYDNYFLITTSGSSGLFNIGTFTKLDIKDSSNNQIGTCYVRSIEKVDSSKFKLYVFNLSLNTGKTINDIDKFVSSSPAATLKLATPKTLYNPLNTPLVYNTGFEKISSATDISLFYKKFFANQTVSSSTVTISLTGNEQFYSVSPNDYLVSDGSAYIAVTNVVLSGGNQTATLTLSGFSTGTVNIIANIRNVNAQPNIKIPVKTKTSQGYCTQTTTNSNVVYLQSYEPDINNYYQNCKIRFLSGTGASTAIYTISYYNETQKSVTISGNVIVDTSTYYEIVPEFTVGTTDLSKGYFVHSLPGGLNDNTFITLSGAYDGIGLIKVYKNLSNNDTDWFETSKDITYMFEFDGGQTEEAYRECKIKLRSGMSLPNGTVLHIFFNRFTHTFNDGFYNVSSYPSNDKNIYVAQDIEGNYVDLKNCFDFRPVYVTGSEFISPNKTPIPYSLLSVDLSYYLAKIVKIIATADGEFAVLEGSSARNPKPPADVDYGMTLYTIYLSPYTNNKNSTKIKYIENKRYTMRDIGKLEKRIENIEYYTSLSLVESSTVAMEVKDTAGNTRFKNGILVDSFEGHNIGEITNPDYKCSIDITKKELRPLFKQRAFTLYPLSYNNMIVHSNGIATRTYTLQNYIVQNKASRKVNVNPYSVFLWRGSVTLNPSSDIWKDTKIRPTNINNTNNLNNNISFGSTPWNTNFNDWNTNWSGNWVINTQTQQQFEEVIEERETWEPDLLSFGNTEIWIRNGGSMRLSWTDPFTGQALQTPVYVAWQRQMDGSERATAVIPARLQRTQQVVNRPTGALVQTQTVVRPTIQVQNTNLGDVVVNVDYIPYIRPRTVTFTAKGLKPNTTVYAFFDDVSVSQYITPSTLVTNSAGEVSGTFNIPANKFLTGERLFRLTDSSTNDRSQETTFAEAKYFAQGLEEEKVTLNIQTASIGFETSQIQTVVQPVDPLAQSFFVDPVIYPNGLFIKEIDIFFASKDNAIPVILQIRENVNGYPSNTEILAEVLKPASQVSTSQDGSVATTFSFPSPVYLKPGEYSIVLISNSNKYEVWVAEIGEKEISTNTLISEQPYVGSFFKSQNASTWTAEQTQDLKFTIKMCNFTGTTFNMVLTDFLNPSTEPDIYVTIPVLETVSSGIDIRAGNLTERNIVIGSIVSGSGIPANTTITGINYVENKITLSNSVTTTITQGSLLGVLRKADIENALDARNIMNLFRTSLSVFNPFNNIRLSYTFRAKQYGSGSLGSETPFTPGNNYELPTPCQIDVANESFRVGIYGTADALGQFVSPVINLQRNYFVAVENIINSPVITSTFETNATGGEAYARYITKKVTLTDISNYLRIYLDMYRPQNTDVKVFYRVLRESDAGTIYEKSWEKTVTTDNINSIYSNKESDFFEVCFVPADPSSGNPLINIGDFIEFQVKIVLLSSNTCVVPKVKRLRILALE